MRDFRQMRKDLKHLITQARQEYLRDKIEKFKDKTLIWRLLEREGLTASKSIMSTHVFSVSELSEYYSEVSSVHSPCSIAQLDEIILNTPSVVPYSILPL